MSPKRSHPMVVIVAAELSPWYDAGGLGALISRLPQRLAEAGFRTRIVVPFLAPYRDAVDQFEDRGEGRSLNFADRERSFEILHAPPPPGCDDVAVLRAPEFFEADEEAYGRDPGLTGIGHLRWLFFSRLLRPALEAMSCEPDLLYLNDWPTGLCAALDRTDHHFDDHAHECAIAFAVHAPEHQGLHSRQDWYEAEFREDLLADDLLIHNDEVNFLKAGLLFSDVILTNSDHPPKSLARGASSEGLSEVYESRSDRIYLVDQPRLDVGPKHRRKKIRGGKDLGRALKAALEAREALEREDLLLRRLDLEPDLAFLAPQRRIPEFYKKDMLVLRAVDPRRLCAFWEVQGEVGRRELDALDDESRYASRWELRMRELDHDARWTVEVEGLAKNWFVEVEPGRRYSAELWMIGGCGREAMITASDEVSVPADLMARSR